MRPLRHFRIRFALILLLTLALPLLAQRKDNRLTASDIFNLQFASDPQISPDGKRIVYVRAFADIMSDKRLSNLWIVDFDGTDNRAVTTGNFSDESPRWSPDGTRIAFVSDRGGSPQLYVRWMDTGQTAKLTGLENEPSNISWSPDGKRLAFVSLVPTEKPKLAGMPSAPEGAKWAEAPQIFDRLVYRFNARGYLKPGFTQLFIIAADGGAPRQLTTGDFPHSGSVFSTATPVWTPDGKSLLISGNFRTDFEYDPLNTEVYEIAVADGSVKPLTRRQGPDDDPQISPDGAHIAYTGFDDRHQGHQTTHLYLMDRDESGSRVLTPQLDRDTKHPRWAPDGKGLYFVYDDQGDTKLAYVTLDGSVKQIASHIGSGGSSYGGSDSFSQAHNGNLAMTYVTPSDPGDIAAGTPADRTPRVVTSLNRELFTQKKLGEVEEFWFNSSFDQRKIQGWIVKPPDFDSSKKYPMILEIHGGPFANYGDRFDTIKQIWAARDYVVVYVNPRGQHQLRRRVRQPDSPRVPRRRLLRSELRRRRGRRQRLHRSEQPLCDRRLRRRRAHLLDHRPHHPLPRRRQPLPGHQLVQLDAHLRPARLLRALLVPRHAMGQHRALYEALRHLLCEQSEDTHPAHDRRGGLAHADLRGRAILFSAQAA